MSFNPNRNPHTPRTDRVFLFTCVSSARMEVPYQAVLVSYFVLSAIARLMLSRRTGLSTGPNSIFCLAGIGISSCPHIIGTSLVFVGV